MTWFVINPPKYFNGFQNLGPKSQLKKVTKFVNFLIKMRHDAQDCDNLWRPVSFFETVQSYEHIKFQSHDIIVGFRHASKFNFISSLLSCTQSIWSDKSNKETYMGISLSWSNQCWQVYNVYVKMRIQTWVQFHLCIIFVELYTKYMI